MISQSGGLEARVQDQGIRRADPFVAVRGSLFQTLTRFWCSSKSLATLGL